MSQIVTLGAAAAALGQTISQPERPITTIVSDSRQTRPGALFVAYRGVHVDGHNFIAQAIAAGATAVVGERDLSLPVPYLRVTDARQALARLAAMWEGYPSRRLGVIGVTGTDGKTTTSTILHSILSAAGLRTGLLTTVSAQIGEDVLDTGLHTTTPDAPDLQRYLRRMVETGCRWAVLETTSHGLSQRRVDGVDYDIVLFTNVTHEHLDEHGDYEGYLAAKARLLTLAKESAPKPGVPRAAILNADDRSFAALRQRPAPKRLSYGVHGGDVRAQAIVGSPGGLQFRAVSRARQVQIRTPLMGRFNVYNSLAAIAAAFVLEIDDDAIRQGLAEVPQAPGRMERVERGQDFIAIVDFAHTPYALQAALQTARMLTQGRVIAVFGSAGLRDVQKRAMMGEIAGRLADLSIITAEDPRTEDLDQIIAASVRACEAVGGRALVEPDRYRALQLAVAQAQPGDVVIACGKGHEQSMCFGTIEYRWDDRIVLAHALDVHLGRVAGPPPLRLPTY